MSGTGPPSRSRRVTVILALVALALALAMASVLVQRVGPKVMVTGEGFCPGMNPCWIPALAGGFPLPYLIDNPQVSVPNALFIVEDYFRPSAFAVDFLLYLGLLLLLRWLWLRRGHA